MPSRKGIQCDCKDNTLTITKLRQDDEIDVFFYVSPEHIVNDPAMHSKILDYNVKNLKNPYITISLLMMK